MSKKIEQIMENLKNIADDVYNLIYDENELIDTFKIARRKQVYNIDDFIISYFSHLKRILNDINSAIREIKSLQILLKEE